MSFDVCASPICSLSLFILLTLQQSFRLIEVGYVARNGVSSPYNPLSYQILAPPPQLRPVIVLDQHPTESIPPCRHYVQGSVPLSLINAFVDPLNLCVSGLEFVTSDGTLHLIGSESIGAKLSFQLDVHKGEIPITFDSSESEINKGISLRVSSHSDADHPIITDGR